MSFAGEFLEMVTGIGRARELGLPGTDCILVGHCPNCSLTGEHLCREHHNPDETVWQIIICLNCRHETDVRLK